MFPLPRGAAWQLLFLCCAALYINGVRSDGRVVCYYTNWSVYRPGTAKFNPQNINPYLCTHLIYAFGGFTKDNQMKPFDKYQDIEQGGYAKFTGLKTYNKQLKTMIAIGGWNEASSRFSPLVANPERRQKFIKNILKFLRQNHFDGIDLDWEYPAHREGGKPRDKDNYAQFVQELRAEFERESEKTGRQRLLVTMAVPAGIEYIEKGYDIPKLNKYLDWFNVLTYDFHSSHEPSVNHHAPLYSLEEESEYNFDAELNIDYSIKFYLNAGADRDKLVLGIPTYGRSFTLINEESTEIGAPAEAPGEQGDATREKGYLAYYEICQNIKEDPEWTVVQPNPNAMGPYAYRRNQWVGYDDEAIVRKKAQYVVDNGLGGIMFWAIDNDDFRGTCTGKPYPLIEAAKDAMLDALGLGINEVTKASDTQKPSRSRSRENSSSTRNRISTTEHKLTYAERKGNSKRTQSTSQATRNRQQSTTTSLPINIKLTEVEGSSLYVGGRTTTPPPPTTPDPGTDFKCEEEGFFQHPRDCKKYYWCLDSGPSGLGIVAHQFTCPSGLYFNPAADSCDFARNVPCKTKKSTTVAPITSPATTTTARPTSSYNRITAATSRATTFFRTTPRTTTTTEAAEEDIEYEEEEDEHPPSPFAKPKGFDKDSEEDPKVIKELIELIRKVGGIEELEKHLLRKDDGTISIKENSSSSSSSLTATTPSSISKSLYEKVLSKPNALKSFRNRFTSTNSFRTTKPKIKAQDKTEEDEESSESDSKSSGASAGFNKYSSVLRGNSRQGPQSEGLDKLSEFDGFLKEKKKYITINRNRGTKQTSNDEEEEEEVSSSNLSTESNEDDEKEIELSAKSTRKSFSASTPAYSTIRRTRLPATTESPLEDNQEEKDVAERKSYSSLNRSRVKGITATELPEVTEVTAGSTRYKYLERSRPTRPTTESANNRAANYKDDDDDNESENQENTVHFKAVNIENTRETQQEFTTNTQRTYASIGRRTTASTTATPETETKASAAQTITTTGIPTTSTKETPLTTPLTVIETTTPLSVLITTTTPITTTTNPITMSTTTSSTTKTTTTTLPDSGEVKKLFTTTANPNEINSDISKTIELSQHINELLADSFSNSTPFPTMESSLDTNKQKNYSQLTTTETTLSSTKTTAINDSDNLTRTEDTEQEEVNLVSKQRNKTFYNTRTRTITTTTTSPKTTTTITNVDIETTPSPSITTNAKKALGVRRQQILLNHSSQTKIRSTASTDIPITTTESLNNNFLGTVSSPRPFGFPKRRNRPTNTAGITNTAITNEEISKPNDELVVTKEKTKFNAAANSQTKKYQYQRRTTTTTTTSTTTVKPIEANGYNDTKKTQVNVNDDANANESERITITNIPETTNAPITTASHSSLATPLHRRIKVLKLKRPVVSNINNTNINITVNANANASSAINLNATQNIVKLSSVDKLDSHIIQRQKLTETEITKTQSPIQTQTPSTSKHIRKVIRKLIRPVNKTTEHTDDIENGNSSTATPASVHRRQNTTRLGFNRSTKFEKERKNDDENEKSSDFGNNDNELTAETKINDLNRGKNKFTLPTVATSTPKASFYGSTNRNRFSSRLQPSTTSEKSETLKYNKSKEEKEEEDYEDDDEDEEEEDEVEEIDAIKPATSPIYSSTNRLKFTRLSVATTEKVIDAKNDIDSSIDKELETTTQNDENFTETSQTAAEAEDEVSDTSEIKEEVSDHLSKQLRNKLKQNLTKDDRDEEALNIHMKPTNISSEEINKEEQELPEISQDRGESRVQFNETKEASNVKQDLANANNADNLRSRESELERYTDNANQDADKNVQEKKVELKEKIENKSTSTNDSLNLQKVHEKLQSNQTNKEQGTINSKYKNLLSERNDSVPFNNNTEEDHENETSMELIETSEDKDLLEKGKSFTSVNFPAVKTKLTAVDNKNESQTGHKTVSTTSVLKERPTLRRKLVAKRPFVPTKSPLNTLTTTSARIPTANSKAKYVRRKFGQFQTLNTSNRNTDKSLIKNDVTVHNLPGTDRIKIEGSAHEQNNKNEEDEEGYQEYEDEAGDEEADEEEDENTEATNISKPEPEINSNIPRLQEGLHRPPNTVLKKPSSLSQEPTSSDGIDGDEEEEEDEEEENVDEEEEEEEDDIETETLQEADKTSFNRPSYKPPSFRSSTPTIKKPFIPSRVANTPYRPGTVSSKSTHRANRFGSNSKSAVKSRVVNHPLGVKVPNLTIKPVANDFERTTVLIPTKPAPFINPNTRAYERKYTGPTTEPPADLNNDSNPLIEDLNIEALNARNKKIFDINSKKHSPLKPKVIIPLAKLNENTQEQQQKMNTEFESDEDNYQSSVDGFATTTTTTITIDTNTQQQQEQEHEQSTTQDNITIGTKHTDEANQSNVNNLNEIFSQDGFTTTPSPSTTLLHIFTLSDADQTTQNPLVDGYQVVPRLIIERGKPKHKVVEINRIVEVNSKEEKIKRKPKANTIETVESSQTYKVESLPHFEQLGEISVVKYVHQVDGSDITIEGRSTVTDYTPTEPTPSGASQPVPQSLPAERVEQRNGKALVPEVIREAVETSTISLEGLFENARKGKVLNTIEDVDFVKQKVNNNKEDIGDIITATESSNIYHVKTATELAKRAETSTESFNVLKSIAFDIAKINLEPDSKETETMRDILGPTFSNTTTLNGASFTTANKEENHNYSVIAVSNTTPAPKILSAESTTVASRDTKATTVAAALFPQYVRPIVPLLRPESNESSPLVISIANLDKVILSKVKKMVDGVEVEEDEQHQESQPQTKQQIENHLVPDSQTKTKTSTPETLTTPSTNLNKNNNQTAIETHDSQAAFSSRLNSVIKAPLLNYSTQNSQQIQSETNNTKNPLDRVKQITQTKLYTINEGSVGTTTSSTVGSKISETVSFSSETTVVRRKQPRKKKPKKLKLKDFTTFAPATQLLRTPATNNNNGLTVTRRPVLSVRRRIINSPTAASTIVSTLGAANPQSHTTLTTLSDSSSSSIRDEYTTTSKFKRLRTNRPPTLNAAAVDITPDTTAATAFKTNNKLKKKSTEQSSNDLKLASSSLTSSSSANNDITAKQSSAALRRKFQARRLTTSSATYANTEDEATEAPRTQNPLFKRRYSLTTYPSVSVKSGQPSKTEMTTTATSSSSSTLKTTVDSLTTTVYVDGLENDEATDQVAKSSIHTSRFNQINGRLHIDDDEEEEQLERGVSNIENEGVKSLATRQPASRFLQQQPQQQYLKYNSDDVITRRMDGTAVLGKSLTNNTNTNTTTTTAKTAASTTATQSPATKKRKMIINRRPQKTTPTSEESLASKSRRPHKYQEPFNRINSNQPKTSTQAGKTYRPNLDYDYYDDEDVRLVGNRSDQQLKVILHGGGIIECLDQGNFPHPLSCRKFISCAKFETGGVVGWEYTCPKGLSYDPVGGMCNWAAGLGCKE